LFLQTLLIVYQYSPVS